MTQTTLFSDKQLFVSLYKSALRRMKGMFLIYTLLCFITYPMPYLMKAVDAARRAAQGYRYYGLIGIPEIYTDISALLYFAVVIAGSVLISVYCNSFMHNRRAVDVFHALPVKRGVLLLANFAAVATILVTAQFICYSIVAIADVTIVKNILLRDIFAEFLRVMLLTLLIAVIAFFCSVCCNASLDSVVFSGAFMAIVPAYAFLFYAVMTIFVFGYDSNAPLQSVKFSPAVMMYQTFMTEDVSQGILLNICYILFAVALMALSCRLYTRRKSEVAQSASTKNFLYQFIILATSTGGGVLFGILYNELFGYYDGGITGLVLISCVFSAAIYLVFNGVMSRNPRPTKRGLMGLAASLAIVVAFLLCVENGFFGYETYIPATEDVKSVQINYSGDYSEIMVLHQNENGAYWTGTNGDGVTFTDPDEIDMVKDVHSTIVKHIDKDESIELFYRRVEFSYELKNGRTVTRSYHGSVPVEIMSKLVALEDLESFKTQLYPLLYADASLVKNFEIKDGFGQNLQTLRNLTDAQKSKLYNAMAQDTLNITRQMKDQRVGPVFARISVNYKEMSEEVYKNLIKMETPVVAVRVEEKVSYAEPYNNDYPLYENVVFDVTQDCINTIRVLEELGFGQYTTPATSENMKAVVVALTSPLDYNTQNPYWQTNTNFDQHYLADQFRWEEPSRVREYTSAEKVAQLADASRVSLYAPRQDGVFYAVMFIEEGIDWRSMEYGEYEMMVYYIQANKAPDFVKSDLSDYDYEYYFAHYGKLGS
ncbi:MAG: ABC transporter permease [Ruminococcaceae bacterium]|nr:ABC transporter permease [Oscillospiraceae bacterium]